WPTRGAAPAVVLQHTARTPLAREAPARPTRRPCARRWPTGSGGLTAALAISSAGRPGDVRQTPRRRQATASGLLSSERGSADPPSASYSRGCASRGAPVTAL